MKQFTIITKKQCSEEDISNVLCTACEGGSNYWLNDYNPIAERGHIEGSDYSDDYLKLTLRRPSPKDTAESCEPAVNSVISLDDIVRALARVGSEPAGCGVHPSYAFDLENYDANDADIILQVAVFGKVIYG